MTVSAHAHPLYHLAVPTNEQLRITDDCFTASPLPMASMQVKTMKALLISTEIALPCQSAHTANTSTGQLAWLSGLQQHRGRHFLCRLLRGVVEAEIPETYARIYAGRMRSYDTHDT